VSAVVETVAPVRVLAIGAGAWGKNIVRTLHELGLLAGVVEADSARHEELRSAYGVPVAASVDGVDPAGYDAVAIATPAHTHFAVAQQALQSGKHAFVEKPITLDSAEAQGLADLAQTNGKTLMVGHLLLYQPAVSFMRQMVENGEIGPLRSVHIQRLNLGRARAVEDVLWSLGVHDVAQVIHLVQDEPVAVTAVGDDFLTPGIADDTHLHLTFASGARAHIHNSWLWPTRSRQTVVVGTTGMLVFDEFAQTVTLHRKSIDANLVNVDGGEEVVFEDKTPPLARELQHFADCCRTGATPLSGPDHAVTVVKLLEQATAAMKTNQMVKA
jgi:predicted dehydrogenase